MKKFFTVFFFLTFLSACASKYQISNQPVFPQTGAGYLLPAEQSMATFIGTGLEGDSQTFSGTHYGTATVTIGRSYHSALNLPCREAYVQGSQRTRIAACKDQKVGWILAPDILGNGAL
ncbi:MAG: hypothetical protein IKO41_01270 [Lachnospiraceae bacterium]|nr:hypothetical protein [Lachnospiraceae bacterium]